MLGVLWQYVKEHKWLYLSIVLALLIYDGSILVPTQVIQRLVDALAQESLTGQQLLGDVGFLVLATLVGYASESYWHYKLFQASTRFKFLYQQRAFRKLVQMRTPFYEKFRSGDILTRFSTDVDGMREMVGYGLMIVLYGGGMVAFILPAMFVISWEISLVAVIPLLILMTVTYFLGKYMDKVIEANREAVAALNDEVLETVEGIRVTRAYSKKAEQGKVFRKRTKGLAQAGNRIAMVQYIFGPLASILVGISTLSVLLMGAFYLSQGQVSLGQVIALQLYTVSLLEPFWVLSDFVAIYQTGNTSFKKVNEMVQATDDLEADGERELDQLDQIQFSGYSFAYPGAKQESLHQINWQIQAGQTLGIVGKTGSGKTSLVRQFLRQYPVGQGDFQVNGRPVTDYRRKSLEEKIGYVPQEHILFSKSVADNVALGRLGASEEELGQAIETAAFTEDLERMPEGLATMIGERGVSISGGQKQRISLARAFLRDPELLILDDSLSAVDARTEARIIRNIKKERAGKTNIIVSHRLSAVHEADWILVLDQGRVVEEGTAEHLLATKGWYYEQYLRQEQKGGQA